jgi:hypothetical protein
MKCATNEENKIVIMATLETLLSQPIVNIFSIFFLRCEDVICPYVIL